MIKNPAKGLFLSLITLSRLSSTWNYVSLMKDISSMMRIFTSHHICLSSSVSALLVNINVALHIVIPPTSIAAVPVYAVKRKVNSLHHILAARQNAKQKCLTTLTAELSPPQQVLIKRTLSVVPDHFTLSALL